MDERLVLEAQETALIMVDMQNDFCHPDGFFFRASDRMREIGLEPRLVQGSMGKMAELLQAAREAGTFVVHTRIVRDPDLFNDVRSLHKIVGKTFQVYPEVSEEALRPLVPGSWGADTHEELKPRAGEYVLVKRAMSSFYQTDLELVLRRRGIRTVVIAGTVTYVCVLHTAFDAQARDFDVVVVSDGTASWEPELQQPTMRIVDLVLGAAMPVSEVVESMRQATAAR